MYRYLPLLLLCVGCNAPTEVYGPRLSEQGKVVSLLYNPAFHDSDSNVGFTTNGDVAITSTNIDIPATYGVVFQCQHGRFAVVGPEQKHQTLYHKLTPGEDVVIFYRERFLDYPDGEKKRDGYDFIDAVPGTVPAEKPLPSTN